MKCFYHSAYLDGKCSAAIVKRAYPEIELFPINYGQPFPFDELVKDETVIMVDFSLQPFSEMLRIANITSEFIWIDHHKTAIEASENFEIKFKGIRRIGIGACALTWKYFIDSHIPTSVELLAKYDVWDPRNPQTLPFQYALRTLDTKVENTYLWEKLFTEGSWVYNIIKDGESILKYIKADNKAKCSALWFETDLDGLNICAANHGPSNGQFFDSIFDEDKFDAMCLFYRHPKPSMWKVSLYTTKKDIDVSKVTKKYGGGGHVGAAGFQCDVLPFIW